MPRKPFADPANLSKIGNSVGVTQPIEMLREHGLVDEEDQPVDDADVEQAIVEENGERKLVTEIPLDA